MAIDLDIDNMVVGRTEAYTEYRNSLSDTLTAWVTAGDTTIQGTFERGGPTAGSVTFSGLTPSTTYTVYGEGDYEFGTFTTLPDDPKAATESQWSTLIQEIKDIKTRIDNLT